MTSTPWGQSQGSQAYGAGIVSYYTASHGGFHVCPTLQAKMPEYLRKPGGWYEEDCDWCLVAIAFPDRFDAEARKAAEETFKNWHPGAWERHNGRELEAGESYIRDQQTFYADHKGSWLVVAAWGDWAEGVPAGSVAVLAKIGGRENPHGLERAFLVPAAEYQVRSGFAFVVDPAKYPEAPIPTGRTKAA